MRDYRSFFTPLELGMILMKEIPIQNDSNVIDICCGSSNLLKSAYMKNENIQMFGVDLNLDYIDNTLNCSYYDTDGREFAINSYRENNLFDVVLANPPFELGKKDSRFDELCTCNRDFSVLNTSNLLVEMILANLLLVKKDGYLLLIVPSSIIGAENFLKLRILIGKNYLIKKIWDIPNNIFQGKEVYTNAILIQNSCSNHANTCFFEKVEYEGDNLIITNIKKFSYDLIRSGKWKAVKKVVDNFFPNIKIVRGNISSAMFTQNGTPVLHISKKEDSKPWEPKIEKFVLETGRNYNMAYDGDLIISRIGRDAGYIYEYKGSGEYVSDCILVIKGIKYRKLMSFLRNHYERENFGFLKKGTTSKYISKNDILEILTE